MTIVLSIACDEGVIIASDSMGHASRIATRLQKIQVLGDRLVVASSGSEFMTQSALERVQEAFTERPTPTPREIAGQLEQALLATRDRPLPPSHGEKSPHGAELLLAAWTEDGPSLMHVPDDLASVECIGKRFVAVGSASDFAHVVYETLSHHFESPLTLAQGRMLAYRVIQTVCQVSSWGVGPPVQMSMLTLDEARLLTASELELLNAEVARWLAVESSNLALSASQEDDSDDLDSSGQEAV